MKTLYSNPTIRLILTDLKNLLWPQNYKNCMSLDAAFKRNIVFLNQYVMFEDNTINENQNWLDFTEII